MVERLRRVPFDIVKHVRSGGVPRPVNLAPDPLGFQRREEEAFHGGVVAGMEVKDPVRTQTRTKRTA
jgi:hypothetical protein